MPPPKANDCTVARFATRLVACSAMSSVTRMMISTCCVIGVVLAMLPSVCCAAEVMGPRRPVALAVSADGQTAFVANRDGRSISIIDLERATLQDEIQLNGHLVDLVVVNNDWLLALDEEHSMLRSIQRKPSGWEVASSAPVPEYPRRMTIDHERNLCFVSSLWSRSLSRYSLVKPDDPPLQTDRLELPFEPQEICLTADHSRVILAGAFDAALAVVDSQTLHMTDAKRFAGHNISGLAVDLENRLLCSMQVLSPIAHSTRDDIHWGNMIENCLVTVPLLAVQDPNVDIENAMVKTHLGEPGNAAGDPGQIGIGEDGKLAVLLAGVGQLAIAPLSSAVQFERVDVGNRPVDLVMSDERVLVVNMFSDSLSIIQFGDQRKVSHVDLCQTQPLSVLQKGEMLFFDARLSLDGWMSCHSCHSYGHSNHQRNDNLSDGSFGAPKRVPTLGGVADTRPLAWDGSVSTLADQIVNSVANTMHGQALDAAEIQALETYMHSLRIPELKTTEVRDATDASDTLITKGQDLFAEFDCARCHTPPTYTSARTYDVAISDEVGNREFNPPSLRGVRYRVGFLHDSRARSLSSVFESHRHGVTRALQQSEVAALVAYLQTL